MSIKRRFIGTFVALTIFCVSGALCGDSKLLGLWQCYKQHDGAKLPSCVYSIEFFNDGTLVQKHFSGGRVEMKCRYSVKGKRIEVTDMNGKDPWHYDFKFTEGGDLFL